jgi:hypothetical protein
MRTYYVSALDLTTDEVQLYSFPTPQYGDSPDKIDGVGFYRTIVSLNAFFHGGSSHYRNWTDKRLFSLKTEREVEFERERGRLEGGPTIPFSSLFAFYRHIGYDYKAKKYTTGEKLHPYSKF